MTKLIYFFIISTYILSANNCIDSAFKYFQSKDYKKAVKILKSCEKVILEYDSKEELIKYHYGLGKSYMNMGAIDSAFKYQLISFNLKKNYDITTNLNLSYNDLGIIYNKIGLPHKSIYFLNKAIVINKKIKNRTLLFDNYLNLGVTYYDLNLKDSCEKYYLLAKTVSNKVSILNQAKLLNNLSVLYQDKSIFDKAIQFSSQVLSYDIHDNLLDKLMWSTNLEISKFYTKNEVNEELVIDYLNTADSIGDNHYLSDALFKNSLLKINNSELSFDYFKRAINLLSEYKNYIGALAYINRYERFLSQESLIYLELNNLKTDIQALNLNRIAKEYGNELKINEESQTLINHLEKELTYANIGFYGLFFIVIFIFSIIGFAIAIVRKRNLINKFIDLIRANFNHNRIESQKVKSDLGKLAYMLDNRLVYNENEQLFTTLDKVIDSVNDLDNLQISSSNKEAQCQLLHHQQITAGQEHN